MRKRQSFYPTRGSDSVIYLLSDLHGTIDFAGLQEYLDKATDQDLLILLGDIGLCFEKTEENARFTERFLSIQKNVAFLDGNHENHAYLNSFPEVPWNGATVHRLTDHIVHLKRGNIYTIQGKRIFTFGGCKSSSRWKEMGLWYPGEEATEEECAFARKELERYDYKVDYILTHKYEQTPGKNPVCIPMQELTGFIDTNVPFKKWYAGHYHITGKIDDRHILIYDVLTELG